MSAPIKTTDPFSQPPLWINPCHRSDSPDGAALSEEFQLGTDMPKVTDKELLMRIVLTAKNALLHAESFRDKYVNKTFKVDFWTHHNNWKLMSYDWLPIDQQIPKTLGDSLPADYNNSLVMNAVLLDSFEYLQKIAVGMEQITYDQREQSSDFHEDFQHSEYDLRQVLCEIHDVLKDYGIPMRPDVQRSIMPPELRSDKGSRDLRDWVIFRDYMNVLEYVTQVFEHLAEKSGPDVEMLATGK